MVSSIGAIDWTELTDYKPFDGLGLLLSSSVDITGVISTVAMIRAGSKFEFIEPVESRKSIT
jgi:hypothetical protein